LEFLWTVDQYMDALRKRAARVVTNEQEVAKKWGRKVNVFESEDAAIVFMLTRAQTQIAQAENDLRTAKARLKKIQKKFRPQ
jgi:uncharacterized protein YukE